ncbi:MAG: hypothetical protein L7H05_04395 [Vulcanisaeta sp.]|nr:hypothetical protein [Vulcanisaeta sp.]
MAKIFHLFGNVVVINGEVDDSFHPYLYATKPLKNERVVSVEKVSDVELYAMKDGRYEPVGKGVYKIEVKSPGDVPIIREKLRRDGVYVSQSYIKYSARVAIDYNTTSPRDLLPMKDPNEVVRNPPRPKFVVMDIETVGKKVIVGLGFGEREYKIFNTGNHGELWGLVKELLSLDVDYLVGYNIWDFDIPVLRSIGLPNVLPNANHAILTASGYTPVLDLYVMADSNFASSLGLQESGRDLVTVASQVALTPEESREAYLMKSKRGRLGMLSEAEVREYLQHDLFVTWKLANTWVPLLEALGNLLNMAAININQVAMTASPGHLAEVLIHKWLETKGMMLADTRRTFELPSLEKVRVRSPGLYRNVVELDFSMLYPSIYTAYNLSLTNFRDCADGYEVIYYEKNREVKRKVCFEPDAVTEVLKSLYNLRAATKKVKGIMDQAAKILANSAYGIFAKSGIGIISPVAGAFIFEFSDKIHAHLFNEVYKQAIYGDTDSLFIPLQTGSEEEANKLLEEVNTYIAEKYHPLLNMKIEEVWDYVLIPRSKQGAGAVKKNLVKVKGEKVVLKGTLFKAKELPLYVKVRFRDLVLKAILQRKTLSSVFMDELRGVSFEDLFIEDTINPIDLFFTAEGTKKKATGVDRKRARAIAWLAGALLQPNQSMVIELTEDEKNVRIIIGNNSGVIPGDSVITIRVLPVNERGDEKIYLCYYPKMMKDGSMTYIPLEVGVVIRYLGKKEEGSGTVVDEEEEDDEDEDTEDEKEEGRKRTVTKYHVTLTRKGKADPEYVIATALMKVADKDYIFKV